jgi:hypothetical protein
MDILSGPALAQVQQMIRDFYGQTRGTAPDAPPPRVAPGPEVFLALVPEDGIAAMVDTTPGSEDCALYKAEPQSWGSEVRELQPMMLPNGTANVRRVYNASSVAVAAGYHPVWRDKLGTWWALATSQEPRPRARNDTGADLAMGSVVQLGDYIPADLTLDELWFAGELPDADDRRIAVLREAAAEYAMAPVDVQGIALARVNIGNVANRFAQVIPGQAHLNGRTDWGNFPLLHTASSTGIQLMPIMLDRTRIPAANGYLSTGTTLTSINTWYLQELTAGLTGLFGNTNAPFYTDTTNKCICVTEPGLYLFNASLRLQGLFNDVFGGGGGYGHWDAWIAIHRSTNNLAALTAAAEVPAWPAGGTYSGVNSTVAKYYPYGVGAIAQYNAISVRHPVLVSATDSLPCYFYVFAGMWHNLPSVSIRAYHPQLSCVHL